MSDLTPPPDKEAAAPTSRFSGLHARTYEMELLLSGAVVLGLLQLPRVIGVASDRFLDGLVGDLRLAAAAVQGYVTLLVYVLIGAFVLHLALRAHWIGLLGLESVFQSGIRWDRLEQKLGPQTARTCRTRIGSLARAVDRADDLCSLIFSFGFLIVIIFVYSIVLLLGAVLVALAVSRLALGGAHMAALVLAVVGAVIALQLLPSVLDRQVGPRLAPGRLPARLLGGMVEVGYLISPTRWVGPILLTLSSNLSPARVSAALVLVSVLLGAGHISAVLVRAGKVRLDSRTYFPLSLREEGIDPDHYRDRRVDGDVISGTPSVQSLLVEGPYLELAIPYTPRRHNALIVSSCPGLAALRSGGLIVGSGDESTPAQVAAAAACLGSLFEVRLDGKILADLRWDFTLAGGSRQPAVVSLLSVRKLDPGRHELEVLAPGRKAASDDRDTVRHLIPFWR